MSATLIERCIRVGDFENDGGIIDIDDFEDYLYLLEAGIATAADLEAHFSLTTAQREQLDALVATMPASLLSAVNAAARARWVHKIYSVFRLGVRANADFDTDAKCAAALGI